MLIPSIFSRLQVLDINVSSTEKKTGDFEILLDSSNITLREYFTLDSLRISSSQGEFVKNLELLLLLTFLSTDLFKPETVFLQSLFISELIKSLACFV